MRQNINFGKLLHGGDYNPEQWLSVLYSLSVFYMARHTYMKRFQTKIQYKSTLRRLCTSQISHKLRGAFGDESTFFAEFFCIGNSMIGIIRCAEPREFVCVSHPVKFAGINDRTTECSTVTVHIFGRGMSNNISTPFDWT